MGRLRRARDGAELPIPARLLIGRSPACGLRLEGTVASNEHAALSWTGEHWELKDLGSKNGTFVGGQRLAVSPSSVRLEPGAELTFGDAQERWSLLDAAPPEVMAVPLSGGEVITAVHGMLALPSAAAPAATVYRKPEGFWIFEADDADPRRVVEGQVVTVGGAPFRLHLPLDVEGTPIALSGPRLLDVRFKFTVSKNEEHVRLEIYEDDRLLLASDREHGYLLLTMARERLEDAALPISERGWIDRDRLLKMVHLNSNSLNVAIHRARQELSASGIGGAQGIVEVRRHERRFGSDRLRIEVS